MAKTPEEKAAEKLAKDREKLVNELAEFGVTTTSGTEKITPFSEDASIEVLTELLKRAKEDKKAAEKAAADAAKNAATDPITVFYRDHRGRGTSRVFSKDVHGDNFAALAEEFKTTNAMTIIHNEEEGKALVAEAAKLEAAERAEVERHMKELR